MKLTFFRRWQRASALAAIALSVLGLGACGGDSGTTPKGMGTLQLQLTDAPFPFDSVARADLFIVRIDGKRSEADSAAVQTNIGDDHGDSEWVTLATPNSSYNLLELQNGATANLGQVTLATGEYRGFRLVLDTDKSSITLKNGTVLTGASNPGIKFPSAGRSGVKIVLDAPIQLTENGSVMVIDFDLGKSFVMRGHSIGQNGLLFKPVIRATARDVTGSIGGTVRADSATGPVVSNATVEILKAGTTLDDTVSANIVATTQTDANGVYKAAFLLPGTYAVRATPPSGSTLDHALLAGVIVVTSTPTTDANIILPSKPTGGTAATVSLTLR